MNTTNRIQEIAATFIESAEAAEQFKMNRNAEDLARHSELFVEASEQFVALIKEDHTLYDCEIREIRYSITQGNYNDAKARYAALVG